jgi:hypothetical protein
VIDDFANSVATYARFMDRDGIAAVREAYLRVPYDPAIALNYFLGLREPGIDLRSHLRLKVVPDWSFTDPRQDAATWHYYIYLATLGEPGALEALADKVAATEDGNDVTNLLASLAELKLKEVDAILRSYAEDQRTADGVEGPGLPISANVELWLMMREDD